MKGNVDVLAREYQNDVYAEASAPSRGSRMVFDLGSQ